MSQIIEGQLMNENLTRGVSPIFGKDKCTFLSKGAYITLGVPESFGSMLSKGLSIYIDIQADKYKLHTILGAGEEGRTSVIIKLDCLNDQMEVSINIQDEQGKSLSASCDLTTFIAKRLFICVDVGNNEILFYEMNLIEEIELKETKYISQESPSEFSKFKNKMILGGSYIDRVVKGNISAKVANFVIFNRSLDKREIDKTISLSRQEINYFNGSSIYEVNESKERRVLFLDDLIKLEEYSNKKYISRTDTRESSVILFRWLFDKHPLLQDLCNELGIQLTLASEGERSRNYKKVITDYNPILMLPINMGKRTLLDYDWMPLKYFSEDTACVVNGHAVNIESFIKFVRHKLGGGHFDTNERKKWQRDIVEMSNHIENDANFMNHHMKEIILSVLDSVYENRIQINSTI